MAAARRPAPTLSAFVLHQYDWSESSLIVDLFTREQGRIAVVARGAKRPFSQLRSVLIPFNRIQIGLGRATRKGDDDEQAVPEVQTLRSAEWVGGGNGMPAGAALFSGFYINELLLKLLARNDPHPVLFDAYAATVPALSAPDAMAAKPREGAREPSPHYSASMRDDLRGQAVLRAFELRLLQQVGLLPDLSVVTATQQPVLERLRYRLAAEAGVVVDGGDTELSGHDLVAAQAALDHGSMAALAQACAPASASWRTALRSMLQYHLGGSVLRTRRLLLELQAIG